MVERVVEGSRQHEPYGFGNQEARKHGATAELEVREAAQHRVAAILEMDGLPKYLKQLDFRAALLRWCRVEEQLDRLYAYAAEMTMDELTTPRRAATKTMLDLIRSWEVTASNLESKLGLDPASRAKIQAALGLTREAADNELAQLAAQGRAIRDQRAAIAPPAAKSSTA